MLSLELYDMIWKLIKWKLNISFVGSKGNVFTLPEHSQLTWRILFTLPEHSQLTWRMYGSGLVTNIIILADNGKNKAKIDMVRMYSRADGIQCVVGIIVGSWLLCNPQATLSMLHRTTTSSLTGPDPCMSTTKSTLCSSYRRQCVTEVSVCPCHCVLWTTGGLRYQRGGEDFVLILQ